MNRVFVPEESTRGRCVAVSVLPTETLIVLANRERPPGALPALPSEVAAPVLGVPVGR